MRLGFILTRHPPGRVSPIMPEVVRLLREWDVGVDVIYPEEEVIDAAAAAEPRDMYVLKSGTELALSLAGALHAHGARMLNPYPVAALCRDKIAVTATLAAAGIPTPESYVTGDPALLEPVARRGPLIVKPHRGSQGRGVHVIKDPGELASVPVELGTVLAQRYHPADGRDRKIYCIGDQVFGVKRVWPVRTYRDKVGEPFTVAEELRDLALLCGRAFGLELYGLDVVVSDDRPYVVDVSSFPGFKGVPDAALRLADYIYAAGQSVGEAAESSAGAAQAVA